MRTTKTSVKTVFETFAIFVVEMFSPYFFYVYRNSFPRSKRRPPLPRNRPSRVIHDVIDRGDDTTTIYTRIMYNYVIISCCICVFFYTIIMIIIVVVIVFYGRLFFFLFLFETTVIL